MSTGRRRTGPFDPAADVRRTLGVGFAAALILAGCAGDGRGDEPSPDTSVSEPDTVTGSPSEADSPSVAESGAGVDVTIVPPVREMTVEYVEAVVNAIETASGEIFAAVLAEPVNPEGALPAGTLDGLEALFGRDRLDLKVEEVRALARSEDAREVVLPSTSYSGVRYEILQVSYAEPACLIAIGRVNRDGTTPQGGDDPALSLLSLGLADTDGGTNPTTWKVHESISNTDSDGNPNSDEFAFASTFDDFGQVLSHDCEQGEASRVAE